MVQDDRRTRVEICPLKINNTQHVKGTEKTCNFRIFLTVIHMQQVVSEEEDRDLPSVTGPGGGSSGT